MGQQTHENWQLKDWEREHRILAEQVLNLERRATLTPDEQLEMSTLKKKKLVAKDRMFELRRAV
jgi:hypothetical protein